MSIPTDKEKKWIGVFFGTMSIFFVVISIIAIQRHGMWSGYFIALVIGLPSYLFTGAFARALLFPNKEPLTSL